MQTTIDWFNLQINKLTLYLQVESVEMYGLSVTKLIVFSLFAGLALAYLAVKKPKLWVRVAATFVLLPALTLSTLLALSDQLSRAKPLPLSWITEQGEVTFLEAKEWHRKSIDLFVDRGKEMRLFSVPWTEQLSKQLQQARKDRAKNKGNGELKLGRKRFQPSIEEEEPPEIYFDPWEAPPSKEDDNTPKEPAKPQRRGRDA